MIFMNKKYNVPDIVFNKTIKDENIFDLNYKTRKNLENFCKKLQDEDLLNKKLWDNAFKKKYFSAVMSEILYGRKRETLQQVYDFLREIYKDKIINRVLKEIKSDLNAFKTDKNIDLLKSYSIHVRNSDVFWDYFNDEEIKTIKKEIEKFYKENIFETLIQKVKNDPYNLHLLGTLTNYYYNGAYYTGDCKRTIGNIYDIFDYTEEPYKLFGDEVLFYMIQDINNFYFVLDPDGCYFYISEYIEKSPKLSAFFDNDDNRIKAIEEYFNIRANIPYEIVYSCQDIREILSEEDLQYIAEERGYEDFEEFCENEFEDESDY